VKEEGLHSHFYLRPSNFLLLDKPRISVGPGLGNALGAAAGKLHGDHRLGAADEDEIGLGGGGDLEAHEGADFFHADELGGDEEGVAKARGLEVIDFGARDDGDEAGAVHFLEGPAERGGELRAGDLHHAEIGDVMHHAAGVGVEVVDFDRDGKAGDGGKGRTHGELRKFHRRLILRQAQDDGILFRFASKA
jgi:hypothetical protein